MATLDELLSRTSAAGERLDTARTEAGIDAAAVLRELEKRLLEALGEDTLRGMTSLIGKREPPYFAARLTVPYVKRQNDDGRVIYGVDRWLPEDGTEVLVLNRHGLMVMSSQNVDGLVCTRPIRDDEIRTEYLETAAQAMCVVLERHLAFTARTTENYETVADLSKKLATAIGFKLSG